MFKQKFIITALLLIVSIIFTQTVGFAAPPQQSGGEEYIVQADDWLSKIAEKYYGDLLAYPAIVEATNQMAASDASYTVIDDPNIIEVGQKLFIPANAEGVALATNARVSNRDNGATVTVQDLGTVVVHSYNASYQVFANGTHIIETANSLLLIDTQFLLPFALDYRAYADSLGKPIERVIITHAHPDHFLGSEAFADVDVYALAEVVASIEANGQAEVDEKQAEFGEAIASTYVVPTVLEPGTIEIDGVTFILEKVMNAEAEVQVVIKVPDYGIVAVGDIVYSGTHLILAGAPPTWTAALENLKAEADTYPVVLPGHGLPADPSVYDENIAWLATAGELLGTATTGEAFKTGLVEVFPELQMEGAIDFVIPFLFPETEQ